MLAASMVVLNKTVKFKGNLFTTNVTTKGTKVRITPALLWNTSQEETLQAEPWAQVETQMETAQAETAQVETLTQMETARTGAEKPREAGDTTTVATTDSSEEEREDETQELA